MSDHVRHFGHLVRRPDGIIANSCGSGSGCSNQCVVEFETNYYDCVGWTTPTPTGPPFCALPTTWLEDPDDCLRATKRVLTSPLVCCTNSANCATATATAPGGLGAGPDCAARHLLNCEDCCTSFTVSVVGGCYAGTYDLPGLNCEWVWDNSISQGCVFLRGARRTGHAPTQCDWTVLIDGCMEACDGLPAASCHYEYTKPSCLCACPPSGSYELDPAQTGGIPADCSPPAVFVSKGSGCT